MNGTLRFSTTQHNIPHEEDSHSQSKYLEFGNVVHSMVFCYFKRLCHKW